MGDMTVDESKDKKLVFSNNVKKGKKYGRKEETGDTKR